MGVWYENFDYDRNPFVVRPQETTFSGYRDILKKVAEGIASEEVIIIRGETGSGKTTLLRYLFSKIKSPLTPIYYNAIEEKFDMEKLTGDKTRFLDTILNLQRQSRKNIILLVDEAHHLGEKEIQRIKAGYDFGVFRSLIIATTKPVNELPPSLVDRATTIIELRPMTPDEAWSMVEKRLDGMPNPFQKESISIITKQASGNPRKILKSCEQALKAISTNYPDLPTYILPEHIYQVLGIKPSSNEEEKEVEPGDELEIENIDLKSDLLNSLSPLQKKIIYVLSEEGEVDYDELERVTRTKRSTLAKQISRLGMSSDPELLQKKGISKPLIERVGSNGSTKIRLTEYARSLLEPIKLVEKDDENEKESEPVLDLSKITIV